MAIREHSMPGESRARGKGRILTEGLAETGLRLKALHKLPGSDIAKVMSATRIWEQTAMNIKWIAEHLGMKSAADASQQIRRYCLLDKPSSRVVKT
jgi:hypothetical protein